MSYKIKKKGIAYYRQIWKHKMFKTLSYWNIYQQYFLRSIYIDHTSKYNYKNVILPIELIPVMFLLKHWLRS